MKKEITAMIPELLGGKDNILRFAHCATRLRFDLKDRDKVKADEIDTLEGVIGHQFYGDQLQLIIGNEVAEVYQQICEQSGFAQEEAIDENLDEIPKKKGIKNIFNEIMTAVTGTITPILIVFTAGGLFRLIVTVCGMAGIDTVQSRTMILFTMMADTCFSFLPVYVAYTAAKRFDASVPLALILACLLVNPTLVKMVNENVPFSVYGIPMIPTSYSATFVPTLLITYTLSKVEKLFRKIFTKAIRNIFAPFCTLLVMAPLALCVFGPLGTILGQLIEQGIMFLRETFGPLATGLLGALFPFLIITGMHHALNTAAFAEYAKKGFDNCVFTSTYIMDYQLMSLCVAALIKCRKPENKALALNCLITEGFGGISEPTIFGVMLKSRRNILYVLIGGFLAGAYIGLMDVKCYLVGVGGIISVMAYTGGSTANLIHGAIACVIAFVVPLVLALVFGTGMEEE